jgi:N-acetylmuramoyl-L-alanine amidase
MKVCFIIGHGKSASGGYDPGAVNGKIHEFKVAKEIGKYACEYFNANYGDADLMNYDGKLYLTERIKKANLKKYDFVCEIHLNAGKGTGSEVYYAKASAPGKKIAANISKKISLALGIKDRGAKTKTGKSGDYFGIIRQTDMEAVLIETAFIDSKDIEKLNTCEGMINCGIAIAEAIAESLAGAAPAKKYFPKCKNTYTSIVDALGSLNITSSYAYRKKIATANNIKGYLGTAKQNTQMLSLLKQGKLIKP